MFILWNGGEKCEFFLFQYLLHLFNEELGILFYRFHLFLEWRVEVGLPLGEVGVGILTPTSSFSTFF